MQNALVHHQLRQKKNVSLRSNKLSEQTKSCLVGTLKHQAQYISVYILILQNIVIVNVEHRDSKPFGDESGKIFPILCRKLL